MLSRLPRLVRSRDGGAKVYSTASVLAIGPRAGYMLSRLPRLVRSRDGGVPLRLEQGRRRFGGALMWMLRALVWMLSRVGGGLEGLVVRKVTRRVALLREFSCKIQVTTAQAQVSSCVDVKGSCVDVKGSCMDVKGSCMDVKGSWMDVKGSWVDVKGSCVDVKGSCVDVKGYCVDVKGSCVDVKGSCVDVKGSCVDVKGSCVDAAQVLINTLSESDARVEATVILYSRVVDCENRWNLLYNLESIEQ
eukprot:4354349-Pyramimonas_sp.AAC.1